ncbi:MAG: helix-turn-helix domain-containing protein [Planctomycetes bacterium]|nr:helix-turn-helix domain-containing protein [Planctomycetota bacterium]
MSGLLTSKQAAEFFQVSERTIRRWRQQNLLPCVLIGKGRRKTVRFRIEDLRRVASEAATGSFLVGKFTSK